MDGGEVKTEREFKKSLMQFTTNQRNLSEMKKQEVALKKVLNYYKKKLNLV